MGDVWDSVFCFEGQDKTSVDDPTWIWGKEGLVGANCTCSVSGSSGWLGEIL